MVRGSLGASGSFVQSRPIVGALAAKAVPEEIGKQVMVAETGLGFVGGYDVQVSLVEIFEDAAGIAPAGESIAHGGAKRGENRGLQQEVSQVLFLAVEHL